MDKQTGDFPGSSLKLGDFFLWRGLTPDETKAILEHLDRPETFEKGARIFSGVHFRRALAMIMSGEVQVFRSDGDGRRVVMNRLSAGQVFGAAALFGDTEAYATEIEALCPTRLVFISQAQMSACIARYPLVAENYIRFLSGRIRFLNHKIAGFTGGPTGNRLYHYLLEHRQPDGRVDIPVSMVELAQSLNIGRSSLYRSLDALEAEGWIRREGRDIHLTGA